MCAQLAPVYFLAHRHTLAITCLCMYGRSDLHLHAELCCPYTSLVSCQRISSTIQGVPSAWRYITSLTYWRNWVVAAKSHAITHYCTLSSFCTGHCWSTLLSFFPCSVAPPYLVWRPAMTQLKTALIRTCSSSLVLLWLVRAPHELCMLCSAVPCLQHFSDWQQEWCTMLWCVVVGSPIWPCMVGLMRKVSEAIASHPVDSSPAVVIQKHHFICVPLECHWPCFYCTEFAVNVHSSMLMSLPF